MLPADLLRQPQALQQNAAALSDAARSRAMLRGRWVMTGINVAAKLMQLAKQWLQGMRLPSRALVSTWG